MILLQVFMQRVCSLTVYLLHLHYLSVIYFYEQKVFGGALIWQLKPQRKKRFCTYFFPEREGATLVGRKCTTC